MHIVEELGSTGSTRGDISDLSAQVYLIKLTAANIFMLIILEFLLWGFSCVNMPFELDYSAVCFSCSCILTFVPILLKKKCQKI